MRKVWVVKHTVEFSAKPKSAEHVLYRPIRLLSSVVSLEFSRKIAYRSIKQLLVLANKRISFLSSTGTELLLQLERIVRLHIKKVVC